MGLSQKSLSWNKSQLVTKAMNKGRSLVTLPDESIMTSQANFSMQFLNDYLNVILRIQWRLYPSVF